MGTTLTEDQRELFMQTLHQHPGMIQAKFTPNYSKLDWENDWNSLRDDLNALNPAGVQKNSDQLRTFWRSLKRNAKKRYGEIKASLNKTGGGKRKKLMLPPMYEEALSLIPDVSLDGDDEVGESHVPFAEKNENLDVDNDDLDMNNDNDVQEDYDYNFLEDADNSTNNADNIPENDENIPENIENHQEDLLHEEELPDVQNEPDMTDDEGAAADDFQQPNNEYGIGITRRKKMTKKEASEIIATCAQQNIALQKWYQEQTLNIQHQQLDLLASIKESIEEGHGNCNIS